MSNPNDKKDLMAQADVEFTVEVYGFEEELTEENFFVPEADYVDFGEEEEERDAASLWENIRKKKEREGKNYKPAKKGDKDRPSKEAEDRAKSDDRKTKEGSDKNMMKNY